MSINPQIIDILARYEDLTAQGQTPPIGELCHDCPELASEVERRIQGLRALPSPHSLTEIPTPGFGSNSETPTSSQSPIVESSETRAGTRIGPYQLVQKIGEGGMGSVWMAEQSEPVRRTVALKVIKPGNNDPQFINRFVAERQALALMDHPNIAKVLDAGTIGVDSGRWTVSGTDTGSSLSTDHLPLSTSAGRPYLVMELIDGIPITKFCDQHRLTLRQRLELFIQICNAIQHAHQKGIIHRDIKPSNVLVAIYGGVPTPKVIDFGVAKATGLKLTDSSLVTQFGTMIGTLEYMSPEQTDANMLDIDTRSDIYALGVLLYELLTGTTPVTSEQLAKEAMYEIVRSIRETEPPMPSSRLSHSGPKLASIAAQRDSDPAKLAKMVRGELDWLVMKALEKDRDRRYETANAFALDVQRYLHDEPVLARPPSATYRLRKFAKRHKVGLAAAAAVAVAVLVTAGSVGWMALDRRTRFAATAQQVTESLQEVESLYRKGKLPEAVLAAKAAQVQLQSGSGSDDLQVRVQDWLADLDMLDKLEEIRFRWTNKEPGHAADFHKAFRDYGIDVLTLPEAESAVRIAARPTRVDLAAALDVWAICDDPTLAEALRPKLKGIARLADPDPLRNRLRDAGISKVKFEVRPADIETQPLATLELLAQVLTSSEQRIAFLLKLHQRAPDGFRVNLTLGIEFENAKRYHDAVRFGTAAIALRPNSKVAHHNLGIALGHLGSADEAITSLHTAIRLDPNYVWAHNELGVVLLQKGLVDDAIAAHRESLRIQPDFASGHHNLGIASSRKGLPETGIAAYRESIRLRPEHAATHYNLGLALSNLGKLDEAAASYREAIRLKPDYAHAHVNLGIVLYKKGLIDQAIGYYREAIRLDPQTHQAHYNLGQALLKKVKFEEASGAFREVIRIRPDHAEAHYHLGLALTARGLPEEAITAYRETIRLQPEHANAHVNLGAALAKKGLLDEAIACYQAALRLNPELHNPYYNLGLAHFRKGELEEAASAFREAHERRSKALGAYHRDTLFALNQRIKVHLAQGKHTLAEPLLRERLSIYEKNEPNTWERYDIMSKLGGSLAVQRKFEEAEPLLLGGYEGIKRQFNGQGPQIAEAVRRLIKFYGATGNAEEAERWLKELDGLKKGLRT